MPEVIESKSLGLNTLDWRKRNSSDEEDHHAVEFWKGEVDIAINRWWKEVPLVTQMAYKDMEQQTAMGHVVLDLPYGLALQLANQYGWECFQDDDFIAYTQKAVGQTFLAKL
jgi:hypothetical protein